MKKDTGKQTRRDFIFNLTAGATAVAGYLLIPDLAGKPESTAKVSPLPCLRPDVTIDHYNKTIAHGGGRQQLLCSLNDLGMQIVSKLDGKHQLSDIAREICRENGLENSDQLQCNLALFLVEVSKNGFLKDLFIVDIVERYTA